MLRLAQVVHAACGASVACDMRHRCGMHRVMQVLHAAYGVRVAGGTAVRLESSPPQQGARVREGVGVVLNPGVTQTAGPSTKGALDPESETCPDAVRLCCVQICKACAPAGVHLPAVLQHARTARCISNMRGPLAAFQTAH